jgi:transposase
MSKIDRKNLKFRIVRLARLKSTGSPGDLATRFGISKRSVKRIVCEIRSEGLDLRYSQILGSYITYNDFTQ